jgi:hypothetical protein
MMPAVLVLGGYGLFGARVCDLLLRNSDCRVVIAGRNSAQAERLRMELNHHERTSALALDSQSPMLSQALIAAKANHQIKVLIHCAGPFQGQSYAVAHAAIEAGLHYIDLADGREFVAGIFALDARAKAASVAVISGASSVPALSSAVVAYLAREFAQVHSIDIGISPGNQTERGLATMRAILSYCGEPIPAWRKGALTTVVGWQAMRAMRYREPAGMRWLVDCDVPDLALLPQRYPHLESLRFGAGLELRVLHFGLYALAFLRRCRLLPNLARFAVPMKSISEWFIRLGSDTGAMHVEVHGVDAHGHAQAKRWQLIAELGQGPYVPAAASVAFAIALLRDSQRWTGAQAAIELLPVSEILSVLKGLSIRAE